MKSSRISENGKGQRSDSEFLWSLSIDNNLKEWQIHFKEFLEQQNQSYALYKQAINHFLDYLIYFPMITRTIKEYISIPYSIDTTFKSYLEDIKSLGKKSQGLRNNLAKMYDFFEYYLVNNCLVENNEMLLIDLHKYNNPINKISLASVNRNIETMRNALPTRYVKMLSDIITEDDFAWPKKFRNQWFRSKGEDIWNPVLSYLMLLKLKLPMRTYQLRYLNSGESDQYVFNYSKWKWELNTHISTIENSQNGVLRKVVDHKTNKEFVGLYINTNKTKDINNDEKGYVMPWENKEVIKIISDLIIWQKKYNPVTKPLKWTDIDDVQLKKKSIQQLEALGEHTFLFRDVFNNDTTAPVQDTRIQGYWKSLLAELEHRINLQLNNNDNEIKFIEKWNGKRPSKAYYDLHSLRVTNLTALYQAGVPYSILSKYIAGHSSIVMTMYYTKFNVTHITEVLNNATKNIEQNEQKNFSEFIANNSYQDLKDTIVFNGEGSIAAASQLNKSNYMSSDIGICPVGESKCNEGGEHISAKIYGPVPNGPKNCIRCRFFITGVPFLIGLTTKFNEMALIIKEKVTIFRASEEEYESLYLQRYKKEKEGAPFTKWKELETSDSNFNKHNNELDQLLIDWQHLYTLIEQCLMIKEKDLNTKKNKFSLITVGNLVDLNNEISDCSEFELYDTICQSSIFYQSIHPNIANIKRGSIINKMLMYNSLQPSFLLLDEKDALLIGNEFVKLLMMKLGKPNTIDVFNEKKKLADFGISLEIKNDIDILLGNKYEYKKNQLIKVKDEK
jgi:site-specific recombinase XerD